MATATLRLLALSSLLAALPSAMAQGQYPAKPVRVIVAFTAGGTTDILARGIGAQLAERWGQPFVIENRPGAGGNIGTEMAVRAAPDGYTLIVNSVGPIAVNPTLYRKLGYNPLTDLVPIVQIAEVPNVLVVHPSLPAKSVKELIALAKAKPGGLIFGSPGVGTSPHLTAELFKLKAGVDMPQVLFKGAGPAYVSLISGEVAAMVSTVLSALSHVKSGKIRALAVTTKKRTAVLPDLPTMMESGVPDFDTSQWFGILGPARTPRAIVDRLNQSIARSSTSPDVKARFAAEGVEVVNSSPEEFAAVIKRELVQWAEVIKAAGIQPQ